MLIGWNDPLCQFFISYLINKNSIKVEILKKMTMKCQKFNCYEEETLKMNLFFTSKMELFYCIHNRWLTLVFVVSVNYVFPCLNIFHALFHWNLLWYLRLREGERERKNNYMKKKQNLLLLRFLLFDLLSRIKHSQANEKNTNISPSISKEKEKHCIFEKNEKLSSMEWKYVFLIVLFSCLLLLRLFDIVVALFLSGFSHFLFGFYRHLIYTFFLGFFFSSLAM